MDFTLDEEQVALRDAVREMLGRRPTRDVVGPPEHDDKRWQELAEMGLLGLAVDPDAGPVAVMLVAQELGRARVRVPFTEAVLATAALHEGSSPLLDAVVDGSAVVVSALSEPGRGWSAPPVTNFTDGVVTGAKDPVEYAAAATHALVLTDAGLVLVEAPTRAGTGLAFDAAPGTLVCAAPGPALGLATLAVCSEALGAMEAALDLTVGYLQSRKQFGVPLMTFQALTHRAADCYVSLELARSTVQYAAMALAEDPSGPESAALVSRLKVVVGKAGRHIGQEAIQLHGGIGMTAEYAVGHLTSRLTALEHTLGDTRHHLLALAARLDDHERVEVL